MKAIPFVLVFATALMLGCIGQGPANIGAGNVYFTITDKQLEMTNVTSVLVTITDVQVHKTAESANCSLSLCDCQCHPTSQTPEELNGTLCGINCRAEFNVSGCKADGNTCKEIAVSEENATEETSGWITVSNQSATFDLMALVGIEQVMGVASLEPGTYNIIRLEIANVSVVYNGQAQEAKLPSGKIDILVQFEVTANTTIAQLDFNLNDSLHITGNGRIIMAPVIKINVDRDAELTIDKGIVHRVKAQKEAEKNIGMDENGTVGEGRHIPLNMNVSVGIDGLIHIERSYQTGQYGEHTAYNTSVARASGFRFQTT